MSAKLWKVSTTNAYNSTLNGSISAIDTTINIITTTGLQAPGILVIDRINSSGTSTPLVREYVSFTGVSSGQITGVTRALAGSTAQVHNSGATIEECMSIGHWGDLVDFLNISHDPSGNIVASNATLINPSIITGLNASGASLTLGSTFIKTYINASGATIEGFYPSGASGSVWTAQGTGSLPKWAAAGGSGTGGFTALFNLPGSLPTTMSDALGSIPIPTTFTAQFINAYLRTPSSGASTFITFKKYPSTTLGVIGLLAGATFASSASLAVTALAAGDVLVGDINTSNQATDLFAIIRAI